MSGSNRSPKQQRQLLSSGKLTPSNAGSSSRSLAHFVAMPRSRAKAECPMCHSVVTLTHCMCCGGLLKGPQSYPGPLAAPPGAAASSSSADVKEGQADTAVHAGVNSEASSNPTLVAEDGSNRLSREATSSTTFADNSTTPKKQRLTAQSHQFSASSEA